MNAMEEEMQGQAYTVVGKIPVATQRQHQKEKGNMCLSLLVNVKETSV